MKILWIAPLFSDELLRQLPALSPAGVRWNRDFVHALSTSGHRVRVVYHFPERLWPFGSMRPHSGSAPDVAGVESSMWTPYWNLPKIREISLAGAYVKETRRVISEFSPDVVVTYNLLSQNVAAGLVALEAGCKWIDIFADMHQHAPTVEALEPRAAAASGHVFLSRLTYESCSWSTKLHVDSGVRSVIAACAESIPKRIVYAGGITRVAGVDLLAQAFTKVRDPDARLVVCGRGRDMILESVAANDPRIDIRGLVSDAELASICRSASFFINPRPSSIEENRHNFPSKLLEYLSYSKPVVSTWTPGIAEEFRQLLEIPSGESATQMAECIASVLEKDNAWHVARGKQIGQWVEANRLWSRQAEKFADWVAKLA